MSIAIKLKPAAQRKVKQGHPWVFDKGIIKQSKTGNTGDICVIFDQKTNKFLALGLLDTESPIRIKIISTAKTTISLQWFQQLLHKAYQVRIPMFENKTNSYRLINGESDGLPGCIVDVYAGVVVLKLYSGIWTPYLDMLFEAIQEIITVEAIVIRLSRLLESQSVYPYKNGEVAVGTLRNETVVFKEYGIPFSANVIKGHKTGYFLDHRANRHKVGQLAKGKSVLDVFAYAGGFSVHALVGGATSVVSLDISKHALELAKQNATRNSFAGKHEVISGDAFDCLQRFIQQKKRFDLRKIQKPIWLL